LIKWRGGNKPANKTDIDLPPCENTALEIVNKLRAVKNKK
jgi:hypothetical protein